MSKSNWGRGGGKNRAGRGCIKYYGLSPQSPFSIGFWYSSLNNTISLIHHISGSFCNVFIAHVRIMLTMKIWFIGHYCKQSNTKTHTHKPSAHTTPSIFYVNITIKHRHRQSCSLIHSQACTHFQEAASEHLPAYTQTHIPTAVVVTFVINGLMEFPLLVKKDWNATAGMITNQ